MDALLGLSLSFDISLFVSSLLCCGLWTVSTNRISTDFLGFEFRVHFFELSSRIRITTISTATASAALLVLLFKWCDLAGGRPGAIIETVEQLELRDTILRELLASRSVYTELFMLHTFPTDALLR